MLLQRLRTPLYQQVRHATFQVSPESTEIIQATIPVVAQTGDDFTKYFYKRMFKAVPCLQNMFNETNQAAGKQPKKLFEFIAQSAVAAVESKEVDDALIDIIAHKHCALNVPSNAYPVVGAHFLGTIEDLLTEDKAVLGAWGELYGKLVEQMTANEEKLYQDTEQKPGGWRGQREFFISKRQALSSTISRFTFEPVDGQPVCDFRSGQFTTVWVKGEGWTYEQPRHYTLAVPRDPANRQKHYSISVKKQGKVSDYLFGSDIGTTVKLSAPYGLFTTTSAEEVWLADSFTPVVFLSAGVGMTPVLAMLESMSTMPNPISWLHGAENGRVHAYRPTLISMAEQRPNLVRRVWYNKPTTEDGSPDPKVNLAKFHYPGQMDLAQVEPLLHLDNPNTNYYFCGPVGWMNMVKESLQGYGVSSSKLHFEDF